LTHPLVIELRPSRRLRAFLVAAHFAAIIAAAAGLPAIPAAIVSAALVLSLFGQLQFARLERPGSVKALHIAADGQVQIRDPRGGWHQAVLAGHVFATAWLVILPLDAPSGGRHTVVLLADSAAGDDLRRLRVWLQWGQKVRDSDRSPAN
jgi:hypothetical protein